MGKPAGDTPSLALPVAILPAYSRALRVKYGNGPHPYSARFAAGFVQCCRHLAATDLERAGWLVPSLESAACENRLLQRWTHPVRPRTVDSFSDTIYALFLSPIGKARH
jgi:hypothetical protein